MEVNFSLQRKVYTPITLLLEALAMLIAGILLLADPEWIWNMMTSIIHVMVWIFAVVILLRWLVKKGEDRPSLARGSLLLGLAIFLTINPYFISTSAGVVYGLWALINAFSRGMYAFQLLKTKSKGYIGNILQCIIYLLFAIIIFTDLLGGVVTVTWLFGIYCLLSGLFTLFDAFREILGTEIGGKRIIQRIRLKPPVLLTTFIPMWLLRSVAAPDEEAENANWTRAESDPKNKKANMEIFIHPGKNAAFGFGHVDVAIDQTLYSYGNYDASSNRLFGLLSDGVMCRADRDGYLKMTSERENHPMVGYGIVLTDKQKATILKKIENYIDQSKRWYPDAEKNPEMKMREKVAQAEFFKICEGQFQTYNLLTTNCVAMSNMLAGSGGVDLMNPQGIITPGTYAEFLDRQFLRKNSIVVSRKVYSK